MSWSDQWTHIGPGDLLTGGIAFYERTAVNPREKAPSSHAAIGSWIVGGQPGGGPVMTQRLPLEVGRVGSLPIYHDEVNAIFFVNGYPENYASFGEAEHAAKVLLGIPEAAPPAAGQWDDAVKAGAVLGALILVFSWK